jgi:hypothetical protein
MKAKSGIIPVIAKPFPFVILSPLLSVTLTLNPSLIVILSRSPEHSEGAAKNLAALRTGSVNGKNLAPLSPVLNEVKG